MQPAQPSLSPSSPPAPDGFAMPPSTVAASAPVLRVIHPTARPEALRAALFEMARQGDCDAGRQLLQSGLVMPGISEPGTGECALMLAAESRQASFVQMLLRCGAPADQRRADGTTALMLAAAEGDVAIVQMLLKAGAQAGHASNTGISSLCLGAWSGVPAVVTMLLEAGAQISEYQPTMFHCKVFTVDGLLVSVGSTNFDNRSFALSEETNICFHDPLLVGQLRAVFSADLALCERIQLRDWKRRGTWQQTKEILASLIENQV